MLPKSTIPVSPVFSHALLIPQAIIHQQVQQSKRRIRLLLIAAFIGAILFAIAKPASAQHRLNVSNTRILKVTGKIHSLNGRHSYTTITSGSNSIITIHV